MSERAVVFGACGFLGRPLVQALAAQGREVIAIGRCTEGPEFGGAVTWVSADLDQPASYRPHLRRGGSVFNLAAARPRVGTPPSLHRRVNVDATLALADECHEAGVGRWLHVSSALAYGASSTPVEADGHLWIDAPSSYVRSRAACLLGVRERIARGLPAVVVSPTIVYGPDTPAHPNRLTSHLRRLLRTGMSVSVGGGRARRNLVYVDDVVEGILLSERRGEVGQESVLGGEDVSQAEFDRLAWSLAGRRRRARDLGPRPPGQGRGPRSRWRPKIPPRFGLFRCGDPGARVAFHVAGGRAHARLPVASRGGWIAAHPGVPGWC